MVWDTSDLLTTPTIPHILEVVYYNEGSDPIFSFFKNTSASYPHSRNNGSTTLDILKVKYSEWEFTHQLLSSKKSSANKYKLNNKKVALNVPKTKPEILSKKPNPIKFKNFEKVEISAFKEIKTIKNNARKVTIVFTWSFATKGSKKGRRKGPKYQATINETTQEKVEESSLLNPLRTTTLLLQWSIIEGLKNSPTSSNTNLE